MRGVPWDFAAVAGASIFSKVIHPMETFMASPDSPPCGMGRRSYGNMGTREDLRRFGLFLWTFENLMKLWAGSTLFWVKQP